MFWNDDDMNWWGQPGSGCGTVLFWALLFVGIVALVEVLNAMISANPGGRTNVTSGSQISSDTSISVNPRCDRPSSRGVRRLCSVRRGRHAEALRCRGQVDGFCRSSPMA